LGQACRAFLAVAVILGGGWYATTASATGMVELHPQTDKANFLKRMVAPGKGLVQLGKHTKTHKEGPKHKPEAVSHDNRKHQPKLSYDDRRKKHVVNDRIKKIKKFTPLTIKNHNNISIENNIKVVTSNTATVRGGVKYIGSKQTNIKTAGKIRETYRVKKSTMGVTTKNTASTRVGFVNTGLIVLNINTGAPQMQEVAGSVDVSGADCAYGSFCTIDLGGPKILTYNDVADIEGGEFVTEDLSEDEYIEKYGPK
jgi:hypothetical protein